MQRTSEGAKGRKREDHKGGVRDLNLPLLDGDIHVQNIISTASKSVKIFLHSLTACYTCATCSLLNEYTSLLLICINTAGAFNYGGEKLMQCN